MNVESDQNVPLESRELIPPTSTLWIAGALEAGGTVGFGINRHGKYTYSSVFLIFREAKEELADALHREFGANKTKINNSWQIRLSGHKAAEIIAELEPYVVSRKEVVLAAQNWLQSDNEGRLEIARQMKGYDRYQEGSIENYKELVKDPAFVAGVLDNRAHIAPSSDKGYIYPKIVTRSMNKALLDALQMEYGGRVVRMMEAGTEMVIKGRVARKKQDSYQWILVNAQARPVIALTAPHLKVPPYEGWDHLKLEDIRQGISNQANRIKDLVINEIRRYQSGEIPRLSTNAEIGKRFSVSGATISHRVAALPQDLQEQRLAIIASTNTRVLTEKQVSDLVARITQEVNDYNAGRIDGLGRTADWAEEAKVGAHIIDINVISKLPKEIQEARRKYLKSRTGTRAAQ